MSDDVITRLLKLVREWMAAMAAGDQLAGGGFEEAIYQICFRMARRYFLRLGPVSEADDLAQDAMLELYKSLKRLRDPARFLAYLHIILIRTRADYFRSYCCHFEAVSFPDDSKPGVIADQSIGPEEKIYFAELLREAMVCLTPQEQRVFELWVIQGYNVKETAVRLFIREGTVKAHRYNARAKHTNLRERLTPASSRRRSTSSGNTRNSAPGRRAAAPSVPHP